MLVALLQEHREREMTVLDALHRRWASRVRLDKAHPRDQRVELQELRQSAYRLPYALRPRAPREERLSGHPQHLLHAKLVHSHERLLLARELRIERTAVNARKFQDVRDGACRVALIRGQRRRREE